MESMGGAQGEWTSLSGIYTSEEADFMAHLLSNFSVPNDQNGDSSFGSLETSCWPGHELTMDMAAGSNEGSNFSLEITNSNLNSFSSQGSASSYNSINGSSILFPTWHKMLVTNSCSATTTSTDFCMGLGDLPNTNSFLIRSGNDCLNQFGMSDIGNMKEESGNADRFESAIPQQDLQLAKKYDMTESEPIIEEKAITPSTKRARSSSGNVSVYANASFSHFFFFFLFLNEVGICVCWSECECEP